MQTSPIEAEAGSRTGDLQRVAQALGQLLAVGALVVAAAIVLPIALSAVTETLLAAFEAAAGH